MSFSFIQITDHHLYDTEERLLNGYSTAYALRMVMHHIAEHVADHVDFLVSTGDLVDIASPASYENLCRVLHLEVESSPPPGPHQVILEGARSLPMYFLPGNHDDREHFYRQLFPTATPAPLMNASFQHDGVQFLCLDWGPAPQARAHPEMLSFLERSLQANMPTVILMHHHLVPIGSSWLDAFLPPDDGDFWRIITQHEILGILCGHVHMTYARMVQGIPVLGLRSTAPQFVLQDSPLLCLQSLHYRLVTIHGKILTSRIFEVPL